MLLNETEQYVLGLLGAVGAGYGLQIPEGKMADTTRCLVDKSMAEEVFGFYVLTDAGRSQLRRNRG